jgi:RNA 2',3'-cyclic 3'-phosphodiesterase
MQRRIFIGISLENNLKKKLGKIIDKWRELPVKWSSEDNLHITLLFLGFVNDEELLERCKSLAQAAIFVKPFYLEMNEIRMAPNADKPKMVWYLGEASSDLKDLYEKIEKSMGMYQTSKKVFLPHVTLGRTRATKWKKLEKQPEINEKLNAVISVGEICVFESIIEDGKRKYEVIESYPLTWNMDLN